MQSLSLSVVYACVEKMHTPSSHGREELLNRAHKLPLLRVA